MLYTGGAVEDWSLLFYMVILSGIVRAHTPAAWRGESLSPQCPFPAAYGVEIKMKTPALRKADNYPRTMLKNLTMDGWMDGWTKKPAKFPRQPPRYVCRAVQNAFILLLPSRLICRNMCPAFWKQLPDPNTCRRRPRPPHALSPRRHLTFPLLPRLLPVTVGVS